jgi:hypothetical protein
MRSQECRRGSIRCVDDTQVLPPVARVEHVRNLLAIVKLAQPYSTVVQQAIPVLVFHARLAEPEPACVYELVQVAVTPADKASSIAMVVPVCVCVYARPRSSEPLRATAAPLLRCQHVFGGDML